MESLKKIVGEENVLFREHEMIPYTRDSSQIKGECICVVLPRKLEEIRRIFLHAKLNNLNIVPRGGGSSLAGGAVPQKSIVMDLSRMNRILELNKEEKSVIVEPGVICDDLNSELEKHGFVYPVIPSSSAIATIGGMLANNAAGLWAVKYGKASEWIEEIEAVDGKNIIHTYNEKKDIMKFVGMEGITGIITKAKLKLVKKIKDYSMSVFSFIKLKDIIKKMKIELNNPHLLSIEYIDDIIAPKIGLEKKHYLIAEYDHKDHGSIKDKKKIDEIMQIRENIGPIMTSEGHSIMEDPNIPENNVQEFLKWLNDRRIPTFGHIGIGTLHPRFKQGQEKQIEEMFAKVINLSGSASGEHGIGLTKKKYISDERKKEIIELKEKYDPDKILNINKVLE